MADLDEIYELTGKVQRYLTWFCKEVDLSEWSTEKVVVLRNVTEVESEVQKWLKRNASNSHYKNLKRNLESFLEFVGCLRDEMSWIDKQCRGEMKELADAVEGQFDMWTFKSLEDS